MKKEAARKQTAASPCAACKLLRRRCARDCVFAPHFPADQPHKFANVHRVFGASNVSKLLQRERTWQEIAVQQRGDAVSSLVYEANARLRDPVYGCVGAISSLHSHIQALQAQLAVARAEMLRLRMARAAGVGVDRHPGAASSPYNSFTDLDLANAEAVFAAGTAAMEQSSLGEPPIWSY